MRLFKIKIKVCNTKQAYIKSCVIVSVTVTTQT